MNNSKNLIKQLKIAYHTDCNVLITGSTGTGKTSLAQKIHENSLRKLKPFIVVNLASLHEGTFESELFGHEKGAFTGADRKREGRLELANGGTVFLDEIGDLSLRMQARLLEFLQSRVITPVGGNREVKLNIRVIAATHKDLQSAVERREFREDLFHRLRLVSIPLQALKERTEELDSIVHSCLEEISHQAGRSILKISQEVADRFEAHHWPGNIRELRNTLEYAVRAAEGSEITLDDLPAWFLTGNERKSTEKDHDSRLLCVAEVPMTLDFHETLERFQKEYLQFALSRNGGRVTRTAEEIGLNKATLLRRIRSYGLSLGVKNTILKKN